MTEEEHDHASRWFFILLSFSSRCSRQNVWGKSNWDCSRSIWSRKPNDDRLYSVFQLNTHVANLFLTDGSVNRNTLITFFPSWPLTIWLPDHSLYPRPHWIYRTSSTYRLSPLACLVDDRWMSDRLPLPVSRTSVTLDISNYAINLNVRSGKLSMWKLYLNGQSDQLSYSLVQLMS